MNVHGFTHLLTFKREAGVWGVNQLASLASEGRRLSSFPPSVHRTGCEECPLWGAKIRGRWS